MQILNTGIFPHEVELFYKWTRQECLDFYEENDLTKYKELVESKFMDQNSEGIYCIFQNGESMIWVGQKNSEPTLVHEILHFVIQVLRDVEVPLTSSSEEVYTYLMCHLWKQINKDLPI